ncbi:hypothetical protein [Halobacterium zhouii]|uniref:hypothetical protein n=1 Tax=Halobacterium zhouii TaxID=2902624 RepID=UPI001E583737|nr:hypothetical protein [Halobacterium zhouii]
MVLDRISRRSVLTAISSVSTLALAGCGLIEGERPPPKLVISNLSNQTATVSLTVRDTASDEVVIDETVSLNPDETHPYNQPFTKRGEKSLTASLEGGETKEYAWRTVPERGPSVVAIVVSSDDEILVSHSTA